MKKIIIFLFICFAPSLIYGQQLPHYSLYMLNESIINPAALSKEKDNKLTLMLRDQWGSFEGAPATQSISYSHLNHEKYKRGISIVNDVTGPISIINGTLSGAYSISLNDLDKISLGASATLMQYKIDNSQITLEDDGIFDPALFGGVEKVIGNSFTIGTYYFNPDYFIGLSVPNILGSSLDISDNKNNKLEHHYYLNGGVNINLVNDNKIVPSFMIKKIAALPIQFDLNVRGVYHNFLWAGVSYRTADAVVALFGMDYGQSSFGYSYDITTSSIRIPSAGTHGLLFSYKFKIKQSDRDNDGIIDIEDECPKIPGTLALKGCPDRDKDGIKDSEDECPDEFGLKINNGCPDKDSDGVADKDDECPEVPGLARFKGCPDRDGDGLQDVFDDCPDEFGLPINRGCPKGPKLQDTIFVIRTIDDLDSVFNNIEFEFNKAILTFKSQNLLDKAGKYLDIRNKLRIHLIGHTDDVGTDRFNMKLSKKRVKAVQKYLIDRGIPKSRIKISWRGESEPVSTEDTEEARAKNRRVELIILDNE